MHCKKEETEAMSLTVTEGLTVTILPSSDHEFVMSTKEVSSGYGISEYTLRRHKMEHSSELLEGKHYMTAVQFMNGKPKSLLNLPHNSTLWTKRGIVRLGFFIKSNQAKLFRDWAEELVIERLEKQLTLFEVPVQKQLSATHRHNRLTPGRLLSIMADVARIDDRDIRLSITNKLMMEV